MSADNWTYCPRCLQRAETEATAKEEAVNAQYGRISISEFDQLRSGLMPVDPTQYRTFREDYEIGAVEGAVEWDYRGSCTVCHLSTSVEGRKRFWDSIALEAVDGPCALRIRQVP